MTPKEKADELVLKYLRIDNNTKEWFNTYIAKQCASIAVEEIKEAVRELCDEETIGIHMIYWEKVKNEINNL